MTTTTSTRTRHHRVPCVQCLARTDSGIQADRARHLTEAGVSADEVERLLTTCPRCLRRRLRDLAVLAVFRDRFPVGGLLRDIAKAARTRPARVGAALGRLEGWGEITGRLGWDRARRCLTWNAAAAGPSEGDTRARFSTPTGPGNDTVHPSGPKSTHV